VESFRLYVAALGRDVRALADGVLALERGASATEIAPLAEIAFRVGLSSLLSGTEDLASIALAVERTLEALLEGRLTLAIACALLAAPRDALVAAVTQLENPDKSGARIEGLALSDLARELDASLPSTSAPKVSAPLPPPVVASRPAIAQAPPPPAPSSAAAAAPPAFSWTPAVDDDMIELFFEEAAERIEGIGGKLIELERRSGDRELLGDLFRDLHTVKGSSAMVGLAPVNKLAHAAEDLVGLLRDGVKTADAPIVDALLATLDGLRAMLDEARTKRQVTLDPAPLVRWLKDPAAAPQKPPVVASAPSAPSIQGPGADPKATSDTKAPGGQAQAGPRQTIRVDFDKLDRLLNLVGELVLGREGLRTAHTALTSVTGELSSDRALARRITMLGERPGTSRAAPGRKSHEARDQLLELTDELGRVERVLGTIAADLDASTGGLHSVSSELRDQVMRLRMVPVGGVFRKHQRTVRDLAHSLGKRARLELVGEDTELDKLLVDALDDPLLHLVRNAVDHGVEPPQDREAAGKPAEATVRLEAHHRGNQVLIRIADDGRGLDPEKLKAKAKEKGIVDDAELATMDARAAYELIFRPGFSTAAAITDVSGRGVGMDVVRQTIVSRLKGSIDIESELGRGSAFVLRLPLTLAIIQVILASAGGEVFAIPLDSVFRTVVVPLRDVSLVGDREIVDIEGEAVPLVRLAQVLELDGDEEHGESLHLVLTEMGEDLYALACDRLLGKREIVIKSLGDLLSATPCAAGATLLGDRCALILDVPAIVQRAQRRAVAPPPPSKRVHVGAPLAQILLVDDSEIVRESLRRILTEAGYEVTTATDGREALAACQGRVFDLVSTDVMMPHVDGYELTRALRAMPTYRDVPIVMVTSRGELIDRARGFDAGVDDYIEKPNDKQLLLRSVRKLLGHDGGPR
jgi:two-component system chemotaxis sensor kinase CheA